MSAQYVERAIDVQLTLGEGNFGSIIPTAGSNNVATFSGLRVSAKISKIGGPGFSHADICIWGLSESVMNAFSALGKPIQYNRTNLITLTAGDAVNGMAQVFHGNLQDAYQDFTDSGAASFNIFSMTTAVQQTQPVPPLSFPAACDVATVMAGLASTMGLTFENNGVTTQLSAGSYFPGTAREQARKVNKFANILWTIDDTTLAIWPQTGSRGGQIPLISPTTGLVGYPQWSSAGLTLRTLFNPNIKIGGQLQLDTSLIRAQGIWKVRTLNYDLKSIIPGGAWFCDIEAFRVQANGQ